ncbi:MAG: hypothetical protein EBU93_01905 [Chlamydiae bacterium]|jgi:hypothetical protein|nr:hypothetical protein [Chlamydiota bacterium]
MKKFWILFYLSTALYSMNETYEFLLLEEQIKELTYTFANHYPYGTGQVVIPIPIITNEDTLDMIKRIVVQTAIAIGVEQVIPRINLWLDKRADEKRMEEFIKIQKGIE